jgi:hypothetical protein
MIALMVEEDEMKRRHHTPEQIVLKLREADRLLGEGSPMVLVCKHLEVREQRLISIFSDFLFMWSPFLEKVLQLSTVFSLIQPVYHFSFNICDNINDNNCP